MICAPRQTILLCVAALTVNAAASELKKIPADQNIKSSAGTLSLLENIRPGRGITRSVCDVFRPLAESSQGFAAASAMLAKGDHAAFVDAVRRIALDPSDPGRFAARIFGADSAFQNKKYFLAFSLYHSVLEDRTAPEKLRLRAGIGALDCLLCSGRTGEAFPLLKKVAAAFPEQQELWKKIEIHLLGVGGKYLELVKLWFPIRKELPHAPEQLIFDGLFDGADAANAAGNFRVAEKLYADAYNFACDNRSRKNCLKKLIALQEKESPEQALRSVERFLRVFPSSEDTGKMKLRKGALLSRLKKDAEALKVYRQVLNDKKYLIDERVHAAFQAAAVSEKNGDFSTARELYNSAVRRFAEYPEFANRIKMQLLEFLVRTREFSPAAVLGEELAGVPGVEEKRLNILRLKALTELRRYGDAAEIASLLAGSGDPVHAAEGAWQLARLTELREDVDAARNLYLEFAQKYPADKRVPEAMLAAADISIRKRDFTSAADQLNTFLQRFPSHPGVRKAMNAAVFVLLHRNAQDDREKAEKVLKKMAAAFPRSEEYDQSVIEFVRHLYKAEEYTSALQKLELFLKQRTSSSSYPEALLLCGNVFEKMGSHQRTIEYVDRLLDKYPNSPLAIEAAMLGGSCCFQNGNYQRALKYYERACELGGRGVIAQVAAGEAADCHLLLRKKENLDAAAAIYKQLAAETAFPVLRVQALFKLGLTFENKGQGMEAVKIYEQLLSLAVESEKVRRSSGCALWCARAARSALKIILGNSHLPDGSQRAQRIYRLYSQLALPDSNGELSRYLEEIRQHYNLLD